ncbi:DUF305 domain-containing protein [Nocardia jinanensis]|nr:DUF305 domain-containing protein [Nocardia jinanensis]
MALTDTDTVMDTDTVTDRTHGDKPPKFCPPKMLRLTMVVLVAASVGVIGGWGLAVVPRSDAGHTRNSADVGFLQAMTTHHHQAVLMTQLASPQLEPLVGSLAMSIQTNQLIQVGQMQGWLQLWGDPVQPTESSMSWMGEEVADPGHMHGMADQSELDTLGSAVGRDANVLFLQLMLRHHHGGIDMATAAARIAGTDEVRALASTMVVDETREMEYMASLLDGFGATPLPETHHSPRQHSHPN